MLQLQLYFICGIVCFSRRHPIKCKFLQHEHWTAVSEIPSYSFFACGISRFKCIFVGSPGRETGSCCCTVVLSLSSCQMGEWCSAEGPTQESITSWVPLSPAGGRPRVGEAATLWLLMLPILCVIAITPDTGHCFAEFWAPGLVLCLPG